MTCLWILKVLLSHWTRHRTQLATLLIGLISATALWSGVQALNQQARNSYDRASAIFGGVKTAMLVGRDAPMFSQQLFVDLRRANWPVSPVIEGNIRMDGRSYRLMGIEPITLPVEAGVADGAEVYKLQQFLTSPGQTLVAPETLSDLKLREGARPLTDGNSPLPPLALRDQLAPGVLVVDIGMAQMLLKMPGQISRLLVDSRDLGERRPLEEIVGNTLRLLLAGEPGDLERLTSSFHLNLTAFGFLSFFVGLFIVHSAIGLALEQRLPMLRTLRACGVSSKTLTSVLVVELLLLAILAGALGLICGYVFAASLLPDVVASLRGLYGAQIPGQLFLQAEWWIAGFSMSVMGALLAAASGLVKIYRLPVLASAQPQAWQAAQQQWLARQGLIAVTIAIFAAGSFYLGDSLGWGFALLAALLLGSALSLPVFLGGVLWIGERGAWKPITKWAWADCRQQLPGLSLALMALLLALAVNVGVGTMVQSFSKTFTRWLDDRLAAEIYLNAVTDVQGEEIVSWLRQKNEVKAILPAWRTDIIVSGQSVEVLGFADHDTYRQTWPLLDAKPDVWDRIKRGDAILMSEQLSRRLNLHIGDRLNVPSPQGTWSAEIAGIYPDYGNPKGQVGVDIDALAEHWPQIARTRFALRIEPERVSEIILELREKFGLDAGRMVDQATLKRESTRIFNRTFAVTSALNTFTLGVAGIALLTSLLTLGNSRLIQLAPLWAIGIPRRKLAAIELLKTMSMALLTALLALPLGLLVAWCLLAVVNVKAFGWRLPLFVFPAQFFELLAVAMVAALVAAVIPVSRLLRVRPATLTKIFSNER